MKWKDPKLIREYKDAPPRLQECAAAFEGLCLTVFGVNPMVTRILEKVEGSSGVHEAGRGIDFRDEHDGKFIFEADWIGSICHVINVRFPRDDDYKVLMHHSFNDGPYHFHMQIPADWL